MERSTNALAELAERLKNGIYNNPNDTRFDKPVVCASLDANDVLKAQRIVADLAWACDNGNEGRPWMDVALQTIMRCRLIAEEGSEE